MSFLNSREAIAVRGIGKSVPRREDARLLTGGGRYAEDFSLPGQAYAYLVRSPHAHASVASIDFAAAIGGAGVLAVLTGSDAADDGLRPIPHNPVPANPHEVPLRNRDGSGFFIAPHPILATDAVRYVGEPVAVVVAESLAQAMDAAERITVVYRPHAAVARSQDALAPGAPAVWPDHGSNLCIDSEAGDRDATETAFARAAHVVRLQTAINRVTGVPMELRAALGTCDPATAQFTVYTSAGGGVTRPRDDIAGALGVAKDAVRVISGDVGGNFGIRNNSCPEFVLVAWAAKRVGRPVKWVCDRRDAFLTDFHGRDLASEAELALDENGQFLALRAVNTSNLGASAISFVPLAKGIAVSSSVYHIPVSYMRGQGVVSNTAPTSAYRSAGRPEVMFVLERLIDIACRRHGFDRIGLRQRNLVPSDAMPYRNPLGLVYDSGDYPTSLRRAAELGDWANFAARRAEARDRNCCRGIGIAASVELNTGAPRERAELTIDPAGTVELVLGTMSAGQGHQTSFAQVLSEWLGVEPEQVTLVTGDTERVQAGGGSASARSMRLGSWVTAIAADQIVEKGKRIAAGMLEISEADIEFVGPRFVVNGTDRSIGLFEVAAAALSDAVPPELRGTLTGIADQVMSIPSYAYTSAVCEVEIDPETGHVEVVGYVSVDDSIGTTTPRSCAPRSAPPVIRGGSLVVPVGLLRALGAPAASNPAELAEASDGVPYRIQTGVAAVRGLQREWPRTSLDSINPR